MAIKIPINEIVLKIVSLYLDDYLKRIHLRRIASILKITHRTASLHLNRLERLKIFKSRYVGKHKEFYLNLNNILTKFYLVAAENYLALDFLKRNFLVKKIFLDLTKKLKFEHSVILFGSYAKGEARPESDIDLLVLGELKNKSFVRSIEEKYDKKIALKTFTPEEFAKALERKDFLAVEILKNHIILRNPEILVSLMWDYYEKIIKR